MYVFIFQVFEATGVDISNLIDDEQYIECKVNEELVRLYIIVGVPLDTNFQPQTIKINVLNSIINCSHIFIITYCLQKTIHLLLSNIII